MPVRNDPHPSQTPRRRPRRHAALAATIALLALLCSAAPALADSTGISGTVTDHQTGAPIGRVQVNVLDASGTLVNSTCSDSAGHYTFGGLAAPATYYVGFESTAGDFRVCGGQTNYLPQYWQGSATFTGATAVSVSSGNTVTGVDAAMDPGGAIAGTVVDATNRAPADGIEVDAYDAAGSLVSSTCTASDGSYSLFALATGDYHVEYVNTPTCGGTVAFRTQYYSGQTSLAASDPVHVLVTQTSAGVDAALIPTSAHTLTVTFAGAGGGSVQFSPYTVFCTRTCVLPLTGNQTVTLTAAPSSGSTFEGWSGAGCSGTWTCAVHVGNDVAVTASFGRGSGAGGSSQTGGSGTGTGTGVGGTGAGNGPQSAPKCTVAAVSSRVRMVRPAVHTPARSKGHRARRVKAKPAVPTVALRYRCDQPVRLTEHAAARILIAVKGRHRTRVRTISLAAHAWSTPAGTGTLAVTVPAAVLRAVRSRATVSLAFTVGYGNAHGSATARATIARLRA